MSKELKAYNVVASNETENYINGETNLAFEAYDVDDVDALLAEKDQEIAELKKKLMPCLNGDCILTCEVVEKYGKENAEFKQKLEDAKASHYAEMVDAGMRERRLKRALYIVLARLFCCMRELAARNALYDDECKWDNFKTTCLKKAEEYK